MLRPLVFFACCGGLADAWHLTKGMLPSLAKTRRPSLPAGSSKRLEGGKGKSVNVPLKNVRISSAFTGTKIRARWMQHTRLVPCAFGCAFGLTNTAATGHIRRMFRHSVSAGSGNKLYGKKRALHEHDTMGHTIYACLFPLPETDDVFRAWAVSAPCFCLGGAAVPRPASPPCSGCPPNTRKSDPGCAVMHPLSGVDA